MKPYIFLSENYLKHAQDSNSQAVDIRSVVNAQTPFAATVFFADRYGNIVNRTIDTLILKNTDIVNMTVETVNGGGTYTTAFTLANNTASTVFIKKANPVTTSSIRITVPNDGTNPAYVNAQFGVYSFVCNLLALTDSNYKKDTNQGGFRTVSGTYVHWHDYKKWSDKLKIENLTREQFNLLTAQTDNGEMTVVPYQDLEVNEIYECAVETDYSYGLDRKTELFNLELELKEL